MRAVAGNPACKNGAFIVLSSPPSSPLFLSVRVLLLRNQRSGLAFIELHLLTPVYVPYRLPASAFAGRSRFECRRAASVLAVCEYLPTSLTSFIINSGAGLLSTIKKEDVLVSQFVVKGE